MFSHVMRHQKAAIVIIIAVLLAILSFLAVTTKPSTAEAFENGTNRVNQEYLNALYKAKGVESCGVLSGSDYASTNYIDTLRIRKWKPAETDPEYSNYLKSLSNQEYCYFFMDDDKRMLKTEEHPDGYASVIDPLANFQNCSKGNTLFKDASIVTDVFESTGYDVTHNLPYKKCVLKINRQDAAVPEKVDSFWQGFGSANNNAFCEGIANTLKVEANAYINKIKELAASLLPFRQTYTDIGRLSDSVTMCEATNSNLRFTISASNQALINLQQTIGESNDRYGATIVDQQTQLDELTRQVQVKTSDLTGLTNHFDAILTEDITTVSKNIQSTAAKRNKCRAEQGRVNQVYMVEKEDFDALTMSYKQLSADHANCEKYVQELKVLIEEQKPLLLSMEQKLASVRERLAQCTTDQARLIQDERFWRERLRLTQNDFNRCNDARAKLEARIASLKQAKDALIKEIEEIKRRCRDDQSSFNMATVNIHREAAKEIISTEQQRCSASIAMRKRRVELMNEINGILTQAGSCDRVVATCKCYKRVATFAWNDHGISGGRLATTTGRIKEVRKNLAGAPFIQFEVNGQKSGIMRITKTRKKVGGGSYIDVAGGYNGPRGVRTAIMFQQV